MAHSDNAGILAKRTELFLKGGVYSITYKQLVLDLLTKRLSPKIISGFIINNVHKIKPNDPESFLCKLLIEGPEGNPDAFIKGFTSQAH